MFKQTCPKRHVEAYMLKHKCSKRMIKKESCNMLEKHVQKDMFKKTCPKRHVQKDMFKKTC